MKIILNNFEAILEDYWGPLVDLGPLIEKYYIHYHQIVSDQDPNMRQRNI